MKCLGHTLSAAGIGLDPKKLQTILDWPRPVTGAQLQSFLGLITFVRHHVRHIGELSGPLESVKLNKLIDWSPALIECFETIKLALARAPILKFPDFNRPFYLATDASQTGVGGVLYQPLLVMILLVITLSLFVLASSMIASNDTAFTKNNSTVLSIAFVNSIRIYGAVLMLLCILITNRSFICFSRRFCR